MDVRDRHSQWCEKRIAAVDCVLQAMDVDATERFLTLLDEATSIFVTGQGRSGLVAQCFAMRLMQMGLTTHVVGETTCPHIDSGDLLVACSCSGETTTTLQMLSKANYSGAMVVGLTSQKESALGEEASHVVCLPVERGKPMPEDKTGAFPDNSLFEEALLLYCDAVVELLMQRMNVPPDRLVRLHANLE